MSMYDLPFFPVAGGIGDTGKDGISPTITVTDTDGGHRLTIVDAVGSKTVDILDGADGIDGQQGAAGKNGINAIITGATASVDNTSGTPKVSVALGGTESARTFEFSFTGLKGAKGDQGPQGASIQGEKGDTGDNGLTPFINDAGNWQIGDNDTGIKAAGTARKDGIGIKSISITDTDELLITYTNNDEVNLGKIVGNDGVQGPAGPQGEPGQRGETGPAYVLTESDKAEIIAAVVAEINSQA